jgi:hypothetical protein
MSTCRRKTGGFFLHIALVPSVDKRGNQVRQLLMIGSDCLKAVFATMDPSAPGSWNAHPDVYHRLIAAASGAQTQEYVLRECAS